MQQDSDTLLICLSTKLIVIKSELRITSGYSSLEVGNNVKF